MRCDACPVLCRIRPGRAGACDRYANVDGKLVRVDPRRAAGAAPTAARRRSVRGQRRLGRRPLGAGERPSSPASAPAPPIPTTSPRPSSCRRQHDGVDMVTVVTEGIFSYCGVKVKIDTDRYLGPEQAAVRVEGEQVGHVTTAEYGSQMLSLGGVRHLTGGSKKEGTVTCETLLALCNGEAGRARDRRRRDGRGAGRHGRRSSTARDEERMRVGCGSATIGIFAQQWQGHVDEVIVVDDHITGVLTRAPGRPLPRHEAGRHPGARPQVDARALFPGRRARRWAGAAPTSPTRWRSSRRSIRRRRGRACGC